MNASGRSLRRNVTESILGFPVDAREAHSILGEILGIVATERSSGTGCRWLACINPHSYTMARQDERFARALMEADWLVPDGVGMLLASRVLGGQIGRRITGSDAFEGLMRAMNSTGGYRVFFLGSSDATLELIQKRVFIDYPNLCWAGSYSPPFSAEFSERETDEMVDRVNSADPDVLWVGLSAPKQEKWLNANCHRLAPKFAGAIGAVFDFYAGNVKRSHPIWQRCGLEWLPRLMQEPRRLWPRMFVSAPIFIRDVAIAKLKNYASGSPPASPDNQ